MQPFYIFTQFLFFRGNFNVIILKVAKCGWKCSLDSALLASNIWIGLQENSAEFEQN